MSLGGYDARVDCVVFGIGGSYVGEVVGILHRLDWTIRAFVSNEDGSLNPNNLKPLVVHRGEVVPDDAGGCLPSERPVGSVVIVEVDEPVVGVGALGF